MKSFWDINAPLDSLWDRNDQETVVLWLDEVRGSFLAEPTQMACAWVDPAIALGPESPGTAPEVMPVLALRGRPGSARVGVKKPGEWIGAHLGGVAGWRTLNVECLFSPGSGNPPAELARQTDAATYVAAALQVCLGVAVEAGAEHGSLSESRGERRDPGARPRPPSKRRLALVLPWRVDAALIPYLHAAVAGIGFNEVAVCEDLAIVGAYLTSLLQTGQQLEQLGNGDLIECELGRRKACYRVSRRDTGESMSQLTMVSQDVVNRAQFDAYQVVNTKVAAPRNAIPLPSPVEILQAAPCAAKWVAFWSDMPGRTGRQLGLPLPAVDYHACVSVHRPRGERASWPLKFKLTEPGGVLERMTSIFDESRAALHPDLPSHAREAPWRFVPQRVQDWLDMRLQERDGAYHCELDFQFLVCRSSQLATEQDLQGVLTTECARIPAHAACEPLSLADGQLLQNLMTTSRYARGLLTQGSVRWVAADSLTASGAGTLL